MTREHLEAYKSKKAEIKELDNKIRNLSKDESFIVNSTILDYRTGYPRPQTIVGIDQDRFSRTLDRYQKRMELLKQECEDIENWIEDIEDSLTRRIFRMYFVEGLSQDKVSRAVHLDKSSVSRKIDKFLKLATNATNATL